MPTSKKGATEGVDPNSRPPRQAGDQVWSAQNYIDNASFVSDLGAEIFAWAAPKPGMAILDLGCGDGALSHKFVSADTKLIAVDASPSMVETAKARGLDARLMSGEALTFDAEFDLVFSNAALHWMTDPGAVARGVARALLPSGRFVAEFGGFLNVASIISAMRAAAIHFGGDASLAHPWYFPTAAAHKQVLETAGFDVNRISLHPRPTPLPTGMAAWLGVFRQPFFDQFQPAKKDEVLKFVLDVLRPSHQDSLGQWSADYVRLRFEAVKS